MKLSVLIPMYNASKYIGNCLDSLLNQDIPKEYYEIIVMDDGSIDGSVDIVKSFIENNPNILLYEDSNVGAYSTRNKLLKLASGKYIYNIDADDYIVHNSLGTVLKFAELNEVDILGFETLQTQNLDLKHMDKTEEMYVPEVLTGVEFLSNYRYLRHEIWWYIIKKSFLDDSKIIFDQNEYFADLLFTLRLLYQCKRISYIKSSIHRYVQTTDSLMRSDNFIDRLNQVDNMFAVIIDYSEFINNIVNKKKEEFDKMLGNLKFRRDNLTFFTLIKMIKYSKNHSMIKDYVEKLETTNAFPVKSFIGKEYNSLFYKGLLYLLNVKPFLFTTAKMFRGFNNYKNKFAR